MSNRATTPIRPDALRVLQRLTADGSRTMTWITSELVMRYEAMSEVERTAFLGKVDAEAAEFYAEYLRNLAKQLDEKAAIQRSQAPVSQSAAVLLDEPAALKRKGHAKK